MLPLVEDFYTLQGEGFFTGTAAWFIRLGGCDVGCSWCDAKETWNPRVHPLISVDDVVSRIIAGSPFSATAGDISPVVVVTGGEPLMWNLDELCDKLHARGMKLHLETSGSHPFSGTWDWVCLSPKKKQPPLPEAFAMADELKVIIETPEDIEWAESCARRVREAVCGGEASGGVQACQIKTLTSKTAADGTNAHVELFLQPEWSKREEMMPLIVEYIKRNPRWRMSLQAHKYMRIP